MNKPTIARSQDDSIPFKSYEFKGQSFKVYTRPKQSRFLPFVSQAKGKILTVQVDREKAAMLLREMRGPSETLTSN